MIAGVEQAGLSGKPSETEPFIRLFFRSAGIRHGPRSEGGDGLHAWGSVRLLGSPNTGSTSGVVSAFTDPSGSIKTDNFSSVGASVDYRVGLDWQLKNWTAHRNSLSIVGGVGASSPLSSDKVFSAVSVPAFGTPECNILYNRFQTYFSDPAYHIGKGLANQATGAFPGASATNACLLNLNNPGGTATAVTYSPVTTIAFSNQDRTSFLGKYGVGVRSIHRIRPTGVLTCGPTDGPNQTGPCAMGIVDATLGTDASVTGGKFALNRLVFKVDGIYPLPVKGTTFLYLFGSFTSRLKRNQAVDDPPLVLQAANLATVTGVGATGIPNVSSVVLPLLQPDRDFYRFGVGLDVGCVFAKLFGALPTCSAPKPQP